MFFKAASTSSGIIGPTFGNSACNKYFSDPELRLIKIASERITTMLRENTYDYYIVESVVECLKEMGRELLRTKITRSSKGITNQQNKTGNKLVGIQSSS